MMTMLVATLGLAAGGDVARHRLGFAAPVRDRDRRRLDGGADDEHLPAADAVRLVRAGR